MSIPRQSAVWDVRRNTSMTHAVPPDALPNALTALGRFRLENEAHYTWIVGGARTLTDAEHLARFGEPYGGWKRRR